MMMQSAAGLLCFVAIAVKCHPLSQKKELTLTVKDLEGERNLEKRTFTHDIMKSFAKPPQDHPSGYTYNIIQPHDYIGMIKQSIASNSKAGQIGRDVFSNPKSKMWFDRAEASLLNDHDGINQAIAELNIKKDNTKHQGKKNVAKKSAKQWYSLLKEHKCRRMEIYLEGTVSKYAREADEASRALQQALLRERNGEIGVMNEIWDLKEKKESAEEKIRVWREGTESEALRCAEEELWYFEHAWEDSKANTEESGANGEALKANGDRNEYEEEMKKHALRAIAWKIKAKEFKKAQIEAGENELYPSENDEEYD